MSQTRSAEKEAFENAFSKANKPIINATNGKSLALLRMTNRTMRNTINSDRKTLSKIQSAKDEIMGKLDKIALKTVIALPAQAQSIRKMKLRCISR